MIAQAGGCAMATVTFEHVWKRYGEVAAVRDFNLEIQDAEFMVLVGPSGCGKTTSLRMIAGLEEITEGTLRIGDRVVNDVAAKDRDIAMVFQSYALYPHMTVRDNMAFGLKLRKFPKADIEKRVGDAADILGLENLLARKPKELSGGQRQRVALGRAIVREPAVFLMDEPLSNLDAKLRVQTRAEIARLHQRLETTMVYVTHDQIEAMTMGTRIAVMNTGDLLQVGTPQDLYDRPRNRFVAGFIGSPSMNFASLTIEGDRMKGSGFDFPVPARFRSAVAGGSSRNVVAGFRPEHITLGGEGDLLTIRAKADVVEYLGNEELLHVTIAGHDADVIAVVSASHNVRPGDVLELQIPAERLHLFDADSGEALTASMSAPAAPAAAASTATA
jgi:multiple sugar transport system ATP-binding protein